MLQKFLPLLVLSIFCSTAAGQATESKRSEADEKLVKSAIVFLRETSSDVDRMRSAENRLSFGAELASLMWPHDEKAARGMYASAINDFKLLLANIDAELNSAAMIQDDQEMSFSLFGGGRSTAERKIGIAMMVRQQIALGLAEHDPDMSYNFFLETSSLISNPQFRERNEESDRLFEAQLVKVIAEKDAAKALNYGKTSIKDGVDYNHVELLKKIHSKDADKGIDFGQAILNKIKTDKASVKGLHVYSSLLRYGAESLEASKKTEDNKPVFSRNDLREIADLFAQVLLTVSDDDEADYVGDQFIEQIEAHAPSRAAQLRAKYKISDATTKNFNVSNAMNTPAFAANRAAGSASNANSAAVRGNELELQAEAREKEMAESMKSLGKELLKEEREKVVARARDLIAQTKSADAKIAGLSLLAAQVARAGDTDLADEIMRDAERLVNPLPKNYRDFLLSWLLASGYAEANPDKAFPLLESTILRANETISAFVKVAEFIDVNEEMISSGEVQVGAFGGTMLRGMTRELGIANVTLISLAKADFQKTKAVTESFDRIEVRVLAKMLVLRALLDEKKPAATNPAHLLTDESAVSVSTIKAN